MYLLNCLGRDTVRRLGNVLAELFRQGIQSEDWEMYLLNCLGRDTVRRLGNVLAELFRQGYSQKTGKCTC